MARVAQRQGVIKGILLHQGESSTGAAASVNGTIARLPQVVPTTRVVSSKGCEAHGDRVHFTPAGSNSACGMRRHCSRSHGEERRSESRRQPQVLAIARNQHLDIHVPRQAIQHFDHLGA
jgi:hypothetical protein